MAVRNNGGGHYNHSLFWKFLLRLEFTLSPELKAIISSKFPEVWKLLKTEFEKRHWVVLALAGHGYQKDKPTNLK